MAQPPSQLPALPSGVPCVVCRRLNLLHQQGASPHGHGGATLREQPLDEDVEGAPAASLQATARAGSHDHVEATFALQGPCCWNVDHRDLRLPHGRVAEHGVLTPGGGGVAQRGLLQRELVLPHTAVVQLCPLGLQPST